MSLADVLRKHLFDPQDEKVEKPFSLIQHLDSLKITETTPPPSPDTTYRVSHVIKLCPREEVLRFKYQVPKVQRISAKLKRTFLFGENFHRLFQNELLGPSGYLVGDWSCVKCGVTYRDQVYPGQCLCGGKVEYVEATPKNEEYGISGHVDGILLANGKRKVIELKTANAMSFKLISEIEKKPIDSHVEQISMYLWLLGLDEGIILYFDKNESSLSQWEVKQSPRFVQGVLHRVKKAREGMRSGVVPEREICDSITCTRARSCPVAKICFQE